MGEWSAFAGRARAGRWAAPETACYAGGVSRHHVHLDPLFDDAYAERVLRLAEQHGRYGMYARKTIQEGFGAGLAQRHDAGMNFLTTGGRLGRMAPAHELLARTNYFRETYAYRDDVRLPGIEPFMDHPPLIEAARAVFDRPIVEPAIVYANILVPGQELAVHTDVAEFRGINRTRDPEWLTVVMHHSGLFDRWRMPIATAVSYFSACDGGDFAFYPDGPEGDVALLPVRRNTAVVLDTDSVFHGVDPVGGDHPLPALEPGMELRFVGDGTWEVGPEGATLTTYRWEELRFSVSWKAYCFADEAEQRAAHDHGDDLSRERVLTTLIEDLRARGRIEGDAPEGNDLAMLLMREYVRFPPPA